MEIDNGLDNKYIYIVCPWGIGDTVMVCGLSEAIEVQYGGKVYFIIKPSNECVLKMYGIEEYQIHTFQEQELRELAGQTPYIEKGKIFVGHPGYYENVEKYIKCGKYERTFLEMYRELLQLPKESRFVYPCHIPEISNTLREQLHGKTVEEITLIAPEIQSYPYKKMLDPYWRNEIQNAIDRGEQVVLNAIGDHMKEFEDYYVDMSLEDLVALAVRCKKVISVRSGLTDLIYSMVRSMEVVYPDYGFFRKYSFDKLYELNPGVTEKVTSLGRLLEVLGYHNCAIYGYGAVGHWILEWIRQDGFEVRYLIDKQADTIHADIEVYKPSETLPDTELIIVALKYGGDAVVKEMETMHHIKARHYTYFLDGHEV